MPKFKVKSNISHGTVNKDGNLTSKEYKAGDTIELTEEQATGMAYALEDAPPDESVPESTRMRPDYVNSGVAATHKIDASADQIATSEARARQNVLDSPSAEFSDDAALADDLAEGSSDNVARRNAPKRNVDTGSRSGAPASSPTTSQPPVPASTPATGQ